MPTAEAIQLVLQVLILLVLLHLVFLKSYVQEKGKNLATKEDVKEITSLVESVKSQLQFSLQGRLSLRAEEHQSLVDYFAKYSAWLAAITSCNLSDVDKDNAGSRLAEIRSRLDMLHEDVDLAAGKMQLFVQDEEIHVQRGALVIDTLKFQSHAQGVTFEIEEIYLEANQMLADERTPHDERAKRFRELLTKVQGVHKDFRKEQLETYKTLYPLVQEHRRTISRHIRVLADG
jgi:hypothetical protein